MLIGLIGLAAATAAILPYPPVSLPISSIKSLPDQYVAFISLEVSPTGQVRDCKAEASNGTPANEASVCAVFKAAQFAPGRDRANVPVYSRLATSFRATDGGSYNPTFSDLDLTVAHLPPGGPLRPRVDLALTVDPAGHVESCDVAKTSNVLALDKAACKAAAGTTVKPLKDDAGKPVRSVQSLVVRFSAYAKLVLKKDPRYAALGDPGPYFPADAQRANIGGYAILACRADQAGALTGCIVDEESPRGADFGEAAKVMAKEKWVQVAPGAPGLVLIRITFPKSGGFKP